jgi:bud site selection protein 31
MPKIKTLATKKAPAGWEEIEPTISELNQRMKDAENDPHEGKRKPETIWPILRIHHQRSRYIYELYRVKKQMTKNLYEWCIREGYADANLIAKWKKPGYEKLCCLLCIQQKNHNFGTTCICRVPKDKLEENKTVECVHCGCRGCASGDI